MYISFGDYDNLKDGLVQFVNENQDLLNEIKSRNGGLIKLGDMSDFDKENMEKIFEELKNKQIYVLHNGELENYYNLANVNKIKSEEKVSGKEVVAHYIASIINKENVSDYINIESDFKEYVDLIMEDICSKNKEKEI